MVAADLIAMAAESPVPAPAHILDKPKASLAARAKAAAVAAVSPRQPVVTSSAWHAPADDDDDDEPNCREVAHVSGSQVLKRKTARKANKPQDHLLNLFDELNVMESEDGAGAAAPTSTMADVMINDADLSIVELELSDTLEPVSLPGRRQVATTGGSSFIRPRNVPKLKIHDPVARGAQYRREQRENPVPGETHRSKLRWQVRQQLLADKEEPFRRPQHKYKPNNYVVPTDKKRLPLRWAVREHLTHAT